MIPARYVSGWWSTGCDEVGERAIGVLNQLLVILVPAGLWIAYLYYKDRLQPEPPPAILFSYLLGVLSGWSALGAFDLIDSTGIFGDPM